MAKKTKEQIEEEIEEGEREESIYSDEGAEVMEEEDEIDEVDEGFMEGYHEGGKRLVKCANCGKMLADDVVEKEFNEKIYRFCSDECAEKFRKKRK